MPKKAKKTKANAKAVKATSKPRAASFDYQTTLSSLQNKLPKRLKTRSGKIIAAVVVVALILLFFVLKFMVLALVDNQPVSRIAYFQELDKKYGEQIKEQMVSEALIASEARQKGINITQAQVDEEYAKVEAQQGGAESLAEALKMQNLTVEELKKQIKIQLIIQQLFGQNLIVSEEAVNQYIEQNKDSLPDLTTQDASTAAQLKQGIQEQLKQQQLISSFSAWLKVAQKSNRVTRF